MTEFLATTNIVAAGALRTDHIVHDLPETAEVLEIEAAGYLVRRGADGNFSEAVVLRRPCCGRA